MFEQIDVPALTAKLGALEPLRKPHYAWPFQFTDPDPSDATGQRKLCPMWLAPQRELLRAYVRLTGSCPLQLEFFKADQVAAAAEVCQPAPPRKAATICVTTAPLAIAALPASEWGVSWAACLRDWCDRLDRLAGALVAAQLEVGAVITDIESWRLPPRGTDNLYDVGAKHAALSRELRQRWPRALQLGYNRGAFSYSGMQVERVGYYPRGGEFCYCPSLYLGEWCANQRLLELCAADADEDRVSGVVPFVALGGSIPRGHNQWGLKKADGQDEGFDYTRPHDWGWQAGCELLRDPRVPAVAWWPGPFRTPSWGEQLHDYGRGAAGLA